MRARTGPRLLHEEHVAHVRGECLAPLPAEPADEAREAKGVGEALGIARELDRGGISKELALARHGVLKNAREECPDQPEDP